MGTTGPPEFQTPYIQRLLTEADRLYSGPGPSFFPGSMTARFTPLEQQGQQAAASQASRELPEIAAATRNAFNFGLTDVMDPTRNPYAAKAAEALVKPIYRNLTESVLPNIRSGAIATGNLDSSRTGIAEGLAAGRTSEAAADALTNFYNNAYGQGLGVFQNTLSQAPMVASQQLLPAEILSSVGAQERALNQADINEAVQRYQYEQFLPYTRLAEYANLAARPFGATGTSTVEAPQASNTSQVLGGSLGILALYQQLRQILGF